MVGVADEGLARRQPQGRFDRLGVVAGDDDDLADAGGGEGVDALRERFAADLGELLRATEPRPGAGRQDDAQVADLTAPEQPGEEPLDRRPECAKPDAEPGRPPRRRRRGLSAPPRRRPRWRIAISGGLGRASGSGASGPGTRGELGREELRDSGRRP